MRVTVNFDLCCGHALCVEVAPELFEMHDDENKAYVLVAEPPEELRAKAEEAVKICPQMAIDLFG
jgi:ferredoxin